MKQGIRHAVIVSAMALVIAIAAAQAAFAEDSSNNGPQSIPLVMIVVGFDGGDDPATAVPYDSEYNWNASLFGEDESPASYFLDMSQGAFTFTPARETSEFGVDGNANTADRANDGIIHITLHRPHGAWGAVNVDSSVTHDFGGAAVEALRAASAFIDFASYDANGDGELGEDELSICFCVAGYEGASVVDYRRDDIPLMWSHAGYLSIIGGDREIDGLAFDTYIAISERYWDEVGEIENAEQEPLGTIYHELGHALGLPDMYAVTITEGPWQDYKVGPLSLMDAGGWQYADDGSGYRNIPTSLDAWSRYVLGWIEPTIVAKSGDYTVSSQLSETGYSQLVIPTADPNEYFLIENRPVEGHDIGLSADYDGPIGVIIWHIDNGMYKRYYHANQVNDANHRPAVMGQDFSADGPTALLLYNDADDVPDSQTPSGIGVYIASNSGRDAVVHVDLDAQDGARNALHLLKDAAREQLCQNKPAFLQAIAAIIQAAT